MKSSLKKALLLFAALAILVSGFIAYRSKHYSDYTSSISEFSTVATDPVLSGTVVRQTFQAWKDGLRSLSFQYTLHGDVASGELKLRLLDISGAELAAITIPGAQLPRSSTYKWDFTRLPHSASQRFVLEISSTFASAENSISLMTSSVRVSKGLQMTRNGEDVSGTMFLHAIYAESVGLLTAIFYYLAAFLLAFGLVFWTPFRQWLQLQRLEFVFLAVSLPLGLLLCFIEPPLVMFDEIVHFPKAYAVSQGHLNDDVSANGVYTVNVPSYISDSMARTYRWVSPKTQNPMLLRELLQEKPYGDLADNQPMQAANYNFISYLPSAIFIRLGTMLHVSYLWLTILARIGNLFFYILLCYLAIRLTPVGKDMLLLLALLPVPFNQGLCIGTDAMGNSAAYLFLALTLRYAFNRNISYLKIKDFLLLLLVAFLAINGKYVYAPLLLCALAIPISRFGTKRRYAALLTTALVILGAYIVLMLAQTTGNSDNRAAGDISFPRQLSMLLHYPLRVVSVSVNTMFQGASNWGQQFSLLNGTWISMGLLAIVQPMITGYYAITLGARMEDVNLSGESLPARTRLLFAAIFVITIPAIVMPLYLSFTPVGAAMAAGIQGRYFMPVLPLLILALANPGINRHDQGLLRANLILLSVTMLLVNCCWVATQHY